MELTVEAQRMLSILPPYLGGAIDARAVIGALSNEVARLDAAAEVLRANYFPATADAYLRVWESLLGLAIAPLDKTLAQRRNGVLSFMQSITSSGSGLDWQANLSRLIGTGWAYKEHIPGDPGSPAPFTLLVTIPFLPAIGVPAGLSATQHTSGGTLPADDYYYVVTAINSYGETTRSLQVTATTTGATSRVTLSWGAVTDATGYVIYRGLVSGGPWFRLATVLAAVTYDDVGGAVSSAQPPTVNSTASPQARDAERLARQITPAHLDLTFGYGVGFIVGVSRVGEEPL